MIVKDLLISKIEKVFDKLGFDKSLINVQYSSKPEIADYQLNSCFALAKKLGKNPTEIAKMIVDYLGRDEDFIFELSMPAFINIKLTNNLLNKVAMCVFQNPEIAVKKADKRLTVVLDYGGANVAKELHIGHLRSPIIGEALHRLYELLGHKVITDTHLGDWGAQMGLTIAQLEDDGYVEGFFGRGENKEITLETLNTVYPKASLRKKEDEAFK